MAERPGEEPSHEAEIRRRVIEDYQRQPVAYNADHSFLLQLIMANQSTLGEVKKGVEHLESIADKHGKRIDRISHVVYAAAAVFMIFSSIGAYLLDKIWDKLVIVLTGVQ